MGDDKAFDCKTCRKMFGHLPDNLRPNCTKLDSAMVCPKGVPRIHVENGLAYEVYELLATVAFDSFNGTIKFDTSLVRAYASALGVSQHGQDILLVKAAYLVASVNQSVADRRQAEADKAPAPKGGGHGD